MTVFGYARVSTHGQSLAVQQNALRAAGCTDIREEKVSGTSMKGRLELKKLLLEVDAGDTVVVTRIDRLARSNLDFQNIYAGLIRKGVKLVCTEQPIMSTDGAMGVLMVNILAAFAQFETELRKERQREGIDRVMASNEVSKKTGRLKYGGREKVIDRGAVMALKQAGQKPTAIAKAMKISRASVYNILAEAA